MRSLISRHKPSQRFERKLEPRPMYQVLAEGSEELAEARRRAAEFEAQVAMAASQRAERYTATGHARAS